MDSILLCAHLFTMYSPPASHASAMSLTFCSTGSLEIISTSGGTSNGVPIINAESELTGEFLPKTLLCSQLLEQRTCREKQDHSPIHRSAIVLIAAHSTLNMCTRMYRSRCLGACGPYHDRCQIESEPVDMHLLHPVPQTVDNKVARDRMVAIERVAASRIVVVLP